MIRRDGASIHAGVRDTEAVDILAVALSGIGCRSRLE
jgi:hypothetical protein